MTNCYVFDIDGTIADLSHRLHHIRDGMKTKKNWDAFFAEVHKDAPIPHVIDLARALAKSAHVIYVSGRSDQCRTQTAQWLDLHKLPVGSLYMRKAGDHRQDNIVKGELLDKLIADGFRPIMAFDDRDQVVKMWRERGIPCAQVADGNF
jgi:phosphatidate phosphatase APP1